MLMNRRPHSLVRLVLVGALTCLPIGAAWCGTPDDVVEAGVGSNGVAQRRVNVIVTREKGKSDHAQGQVELTVDIDEVKPGKFWIGVVCSPLDDYLLKTHLGVESGLVVTQVVQDSPAQRAGLKKDDILTALGDQPLTDLKVLVDGTEQAKGSQVALTLMRKGKQQKITITPARRPAKYSVDVVVPDAETAAGWRLLQEALGGGGPSSARGGELITAPGESSLLLVMPGFVLPDQAAGFPKDLEVTITKKGLDDAKVTVTQGGKQWDVDAKSLDKLPEEIRPHIEKMLGHGAGMNLQFGAKRIALPSPLLHDLIAPQIIKKSLRIIPDKVYELHHFAPNLKKEMRVEIQRNLEQAHKAIEQARATLPAEALGKIENELKALREQLERLQADPSVRDGQPKVDEGRD